MYTRITQSGGRRYLQLVESYSADGGAVRQRTGANLGRLDKLDLDPLIGGLNQALGRAQNPAQAVEYDSAKAFGDVYALHELWQGLGFGQAIRRALRSAQRQFDAEALVRAMVFNRLCAPDSKLGCLEWLDTVAMPGVAETVTHDQLLRTMDALMDRTDAVEACVAKQLRPMLDRQVSVVFYDLTTVRIHGEGELPGDVRAFGMNKETGGAARQFVLGVVQSADGLALMHTVHAGNVAVTRTLQQMLETVMARLPVERVILVADRGLLSLDNVAELSAVAERGPPRLEFILAVPARRHAELDARAIVGPTAASSLRSLRPSSPASSPPITRPSCSATASTTTLWRAPSASMASLCRSPMSRTSPPRRSWPATRAWSTSSVASGCSRAISQSPRSTTGYRIAFAPMP